MTEHYRGGGIAHSVTESSNGERIVRVDAWDRSTAREVASQYGELVSADYADGRFVFIVKG